MTFLPIRPTPFVTTASALPMIAGATNAQVLYVDDDAPNDPGPGNPLLSDPLEDGSVGRPFDRIQEAITAAVSGTEIRVAAGTYVDLAAISLAGKQLWVHGVDGPAVTIVDATTLSDRAMQAILGETATTVVEGLTLRGGVALGAAPNDRGAGLYINNSSLTVRNCILEGNASTFGGALYLNGSAGTVLDSCSFLSNDAHRGGALYVNASTIGLDRCGFTINTALDNGGAIDSRSSSVSTSRSTFQGNSCGNAGGAVHRTSSTVTLQQCPFADNAAGWGGALGSVSATTDVQDCTFERNLSVFDGSAVYKSGAASLEIRRCRFTENDAQAGRGAVMLVNGLSDRVQDSIFNGNLGSDAGIATQSNDPVEVQSCSLAWNQGAEVSGLGSGFRGRNAFCGAMQLSSGASFLRSTATYWGATRDAGTSMRTHFFAIRSERTVSPKPLTTTFDSSAPPRASTLVTPAS